MRSRLDALAHCPSAVLHDAAVRVAPPLAVGAGGLIAAGLGLGLAWAPADIVQGDVGRIAILHAPAAAMALGLFVAIGLLGLVTLTRDARASALLAAALAPTGMLFTALALWTAALWRRPLHGAWWSWDAATLAQLLLLALYGGGLALRAMVDEPRRGERAAALFSLLGLVSLPLVYFSLARWDRLTQAGPAQSAALDARLTAATALVGAGFACYAAHAAARRLRCLIVEYPAAAREPRAPAEGAR